MRPLDALVNLEEPALPLVREWVASAAKPVELLPGDPYTGPRALLALQVTTRSPMGALAYQTGGMFIDHGWLRVLGAGHHRLPRAIDDWNGLPAGPHRLADGLLIADDAIGGFFALNGGAFDGPPGHVFYLAPDTLRWEDTEHGYSDWLHWAITGDLSSYYGDARWPGWESEVSILPGDRGFSILPFPWAEGPPLAERSRRPVPIEELWQLHAIDLPAQLAKP
jgi:hypothetical protein